MSKTYRIKGDWLVEGFVDNLGRERELDIVVIDGKAYDPADAGCGTPPLRMSIDADGALSAWGADIAFSPEDGEVDRVGRDTFAAR